MTGKPNLTDRQWAILQALNAGPQRMTTISQLCGENADWSYMKLKALESKCLIERVGNGQWALTDAGKNLSATSKKA